MQTDSLASRVGILLIVLLVNTAYIAAFASPTIFYMANVMFHLVLGVAVGAAAAFLLARRPDLRRALRLATPSFALSLVLGLYLAWAGNVAENRWALWGHIIAAALGLAFLIPVVWGASRQGGSWKKFKNAFQYSVLLLILFPMGMAAYRRVRPNPSDTIRNPLTVPISMHDEGGGPNSPFFPSSAKTNVGGIIPSNFFMDSATCGECHKDIYNQWQGSAHHFASFNNQFYRKSVEYMQDVVGTRPSKWCAGCHDHAVFFNGAAL